MHVAEASIGMLGANGIVGAGIPIAMGSALALKHRKSAAIAVAFFGDGAVAEGVLYETLNMAALWRLPLLFLCESNGWSEFSPVDRQIAVSLDKLAGAFGIPFSTVDGNDVEEVANVTAAVVADIRRGGGPQFLECKTMRVRGHFEGDAQKYRPAEQLADLIHSDPLRRARKALLDAGSSEAEIDLVDARVKRRVLESVEQARKGSEPDFETAVLDVYSNGLAL
jgi:pyruvate dehydrogenase E1 component alpha subunit